MPKQSLCSRGFVRLIIHIIGSGSTRGLSQGGNLSWREPTSQNAVKILEMTVNLDVEDVYTKTLNQRKTLRKISKKQKNNKLLKTKQTLNTET